MLFSCPNPWCLVAHGGVQSARAASGSGATSAGTCQAQRALCSETPDKRGTAAAALPHSEAWARVAWLILLWGTECCGMGSPSPAGGC